MNKLIRLFLLSALTLMIMESVLQPAFLAQDAGTQSPQPAPGGASGGANQPNPQPSGSNRTNRSSPLPDTTPRPVFLSGSVLLADGTVPPERVLIERVCNGRVRHEGYSDSKGNFSFLVGGGQTNSTLSDASVGLQSQAFGLDTSLQNNVNPRDLIGCEIRASLAGFQSTTIVLTSPKILDSSNIGVLHLTRLASVDDFTFSITTATAPKDARNAYDKGFDNAKKQKWVDAERDFLKAVQVYPNYAVAWFELGRVYQQEKKFDDAGRALREAIRIDPKFISAYGQLTFLSAVQSRWDDVVAYSSQVIKLSPRVPVDVYFYSAVANYNLRNVDVAADHARQAATLDTQFRNPQIHHLLGVILAEKKEYHDAAEHLRLYLKLAPNAAEAADVKQRLTEIDKVGGETPRQ